MKKRIIIEITLIIYAYCTIAFANPFSRTNRYALSYDYYSRIANLILTDSIPMLSAEADRHVEPIHSFFVLHNNYQSISAIGTFLGAFNSFGHDAIGFGAFGGAVNYNSRFLEGKADFNIYSTDVLKLNEFTMIDYERLISNDKKEYVSGMPKTGFNLPEAYLKFKYESIEVLTGRKKLRWGPGYKGTLGLSGTTISPLYLYHFKLKFAEFLHLSAFCSGLDDDKLFPSDNMDARYFAGQRIDWKINDHIQFGLFEMCDFSGQKDFIRYVNPLQIYVFSQFNGPESANLIGGLDLNVIFKPFRFYCELLDDDITIFEKAGNPNKFGYQIGAVHYGLMPCYQIGIEYNHISKYVYGNSYSSKIQHAFWAESVGWPWGNDQDLFTIYALLKPHAKVDAKIEVNYWIKGDGTIDDDWVKDGSPDLDRVPYWPQNSRHILNAILSMRYQPWYWLTADFTVCPMLVDKKGSVSIGLYLLADIPGIKTIQF
jgi:hypothetical protein